MSAALLLPKSADPAQRLDAAVAALAPASARDLESRALTRRFDRKFLLPVERATEVFEALGDEYRVVLARQARFAHYDTTYFDTADLRFYHEHRRRRLPRVKVRMRHYTDRDLTMLEVKQKTSRGDTRKFRWEREHTQPELDDTDLAHIAAACPWALASGPLVAQARTVFHRVMLINTVTVERATLDFGLSFERGTTRRDFDASVIVEVKDGGRERTSPLVAALRDHHARCMAVSKYCLAIAMLSNERRNTFLRAVRAIDGDR
jgi:hypothetical protein